MQSNLPVLTKKRFSDILKLSDFVDTILRLRNLPDPIKPGMQVKVVPTDRPISLWKPEDVVEEVKKVIEKGEASKE